MRRGSRPRGPESHGHFLYPRIKGSVRTLDTLISPLPPGSTVSASPLWTETSDPQAAALLWPKLGFGDKGPLLSPELAPASASVHPGPPSTVFKECGDPQIYWVPASQDSSTALWKPQFPPKFTFQTTPLTVLTSSMDLGSWLWTACPASAICLGRD